MKIKIGDRAMITRSAAGNEGKVVRIVRHIYWNESIGHVWEVESEGSPLVGASGSVTLRAPGPEKWLSVWPRSFTLGALGA